MLTYDAENRLISVTKTGFSATFVYDGDGNRIKATVAGTTTTFIGNWFEWSGSQSTKVRYYYGEGQRIAMRTGSGTTTSTLTYILGDHLGSTSLTYKADTGATTTQLYKPLPCTQGRLWGGRKRESKSSRFRVRYQSGTLPTDYILPCTQDRLYTGPAHAHSHTDDFGLMYYVARWYDPVLGRFAQADTMVPTASQGTQAWDRYAYVNNNPVRYNDPSGHCLILCTAIIGALISVAVDAYVTTQVNHEEYTIEKAAIAITKGAVSGAVGAGIIAPFASAVGAGVGAFAGSLWAVPTASVAAIQTTTTLAVGATLSAVSNVGLSATQDTLNQMAEGGEVTLQSFEDSVSANWTTDAAFGAIGFMAGYRIGGAIDDFFWQPSSTVAPLLNTHPGQKVFIGAMQAGGQALSNSTLLEEGILPVLDKLTPGVAQ